MVTTRIERPPGELPRAHYWSLTLIQGIIVKTLLRNVLLWGSVCCLAAQAQETPAAEPLPPKLRFVQLSPDEYARLQREGEAFWSGPGQVKSGTVMPPFTLRDTQGREWTRDRLLGKITLLSIGATWCRPCVEEMPLIEKLHHLTMPAADLRVVSLNVDEDPVAAIELARKYSFPVLLDALDYVQRLTGSKTPTVPGLWLVDRCGVVVRDYLGTPPPGQLTPGDQWVEERLAEMKKMAAIDWLSSPKP